MTAAQAHMLSDAEIERVQQAMGQARALINPAAGILGVAMSKSNDHPGEGAVILYVDENMAVKALATVGGVRTLVIPSNARAVANGAAPQTNPASALPALTGAVLSPAAAIKQQYAPTLMKQNPAFFGIGVSQSLDNPKEPALLIYVDRRRLPAWLPITVGGIRTRYVVMDRLHVTRSYSTPVQSRLHCMPHRTTDRSVRFDPLTLLKPQDLKLN
jgi:hypothetical protein